MKILALDSSGLVASAAITEDDNLIAEYTVNYKKTHSQTLLPMIDEIVRMTETELESVDVIAVAAGPGSFTGLRIGSATAKGLGLALDKPVIGVPTIEGLAMNLYGVKDLICPLMDARRNQVYTGIYHFVDGELAVVKEQLAVGIEEIIEALNLIGKDVVFLGDGVPVYRQMIEEKLRVPCSFAPAHVNKQRAAAIAVRAMDYVKAGVQTTAAEFQPEYLRLSQAERERRERHYNIELVPLTERLCEAAYDIAVKSLPEHWSLEGIKDVLRHDNNFFFVARQKETGVVAGFAGIMLVADEAELLNIAVKEDFRKTGIGQRLLEHLLYTAGQQHAVRMLLEVRKSNVAARRLYEKNGFTVLAERQGYYSNPKEDAVIMERRL